MENCLKKQIEEMAYEKSNDHMTSRDHERSRPTPNTFKTQYLGNSWSCSNNNHYYYAVQSAILATAWPLVFCFQTKTHESSTTVSLCLSSIISSGVRHTEAFVTRSVKHWSVSVWSC